MDKCKVAIVIPAYNEAATIQDVVRSVSCYGTVFVVDDASTDNTKTEAKKAGADVISHAINLGYDEALNSGFSTVNEKGFDIVITFDADGQHSAELIEQYISLIEVGADVVVGIRNRFQRPSEYVYSRVSRIKWGIHDPLCGMKAYRLDVYRELGFFDSYRSIGTELAIFAAKMNMIVNQIPILVKERADKPRFGNQVSANLIILKALFRSLIKYG